MTIENMMAIYSPPEVPSNVPSEKDLKNCEAFLGIPLPRDLIAMYGVYGECHIAEFFRCFTPAKKDRIGSTFEAVTQRCCKYLTDDSMEIEILRKYVFWPQQEGCFPFCVSDNGDCLLWDPAKNQVVVVGSKSECVDEYSVGICEFWCLLSQGKIRPDAFPDDLYDIHFNTVVPLHPQK